jgi:hypothetical protein
MKYVMGYNPVTGQHHPIVAADEVVHADMAKILPRGSEVMGAGYVIVDEKSGFVETWGESDSLKMKPAKGDDIVLRIFLQLGLSGLSLANHLMVFSTIQDDFEASL